MSGRGGTPTAKPSVATPAGPTTQSSIGTTVDNIKAAVNQGIRGAITAGTYIFAATGAAEAVNQLGNLNKKNAVNADLVFPSDLLGKTPDGYNYYMAFKFSDYKKPDIYSAPTPIFKDGIKLPIPTRLSVDTAVHYQEASLGSAMGAAAQQIKNLQMDKIIDNPTNIASVLKDSGVNVASAGAAGAVLDTLKSAVPQQISQGLSYATGIAINYKEHREEWCGISAAIKDQADRTIAFLNVTLPTFNHTEAKLRSYSLAMSDAAKEISALFAKSHF